MKSRRVLQNVPSLIHCLGWTKCSLCASDANADCFMARRFWPHDVVKFRSSVCVCVCCELVEVSEKERKKERGKELGRGETDIPKEQFIVMAECAVTVKV